MAIQRRAEQGVGSHSTLTIETATCSLVKIILRVAGT